MPALIEARPSLEQERIADALRSARYPYPSRETLVPRPGRAIQSDKDILAYMATIVAESRSRVLREKISQMEMLRRNWDTYGAEPPNLAAKNQALELLSFLDPLEFLPTDALASAEGGVALVFATGNRYADIEVLNSGEILAVTFTRGEEPVAWEVEKNEPDISRAIGRIYEHISA